MLKALLCAWHLMDTQWYLLNESILPTLTFPILYPALQPVSWPLDPCSFPSSIFVLIPPAPVCLPTPAPPSNSTSITEQSLYCPALHTFSSQTPITSYDNQASPSGLAYFLLCKLPEVRNSRRVFYSIAHSPTTWRGIHKYLLDEKKLLLEERKHNLISQIAQYYHLTAW